MKIGDLVKCHGVLGLSKTVIGTIIGFNEQGEGGKDFVHVLYNGEIQVFMEFDIEVINSSKK